MCSEVYEIDIAEEFSYFHGTILKLKIKHPMLFHSISVLLFLNVR